MRVVSLLISSDNCMNMLDLYYRLVLTKAVSIKQKQRTNELDNGKKRRISTAFKLKAEC
jgi:hypothetical protein